MNEVVRSSEMVGVKECVYIVIKRLFDIIGGLIGLILLIPIMILVKIAYMCSGDFGKIIFTQNRIGKNGKEFKFYKFRSMVVNADDVLKELLKQDEELAKEYKENKKFREDPRITKVGKFIRKASIDELPQLINVLKGDMSLIGNRPYLPREKEDMGSFYEDIIKTKPGITGYWQVSGRSDLSFRKRLELEQYYSNHYGFKMDMKIFFRTFSVVLGKNGAK